MDGGEPSECTPVAELIQLANKSNAATTWSPTFA